MDRPTLADEFLLAVTVAIADALIRLAYDKSEYGALTVRRQRSLDRTDGLNKGEFLAHRNVHRSEDETANPTIEGTG